MHCQYKFILYAYVKSFYTDNKYINQTQQRNHLVTNMSYGGLIWKNNKNDNQM